MKSKINYKKRWLNILSSELEIHSEYQEIMKKNSEAVDLDWVFELNRRRKVLLIDLVGRIGFQDKGDLREKPKYLKVDGSSKEIAGYLMNLEAKRLNELKKCSDEFFCPPEWKQLIVENLAPLAKENLDQISKRLH